MVTDPPAFRLGVLVALWRRPEVSRAVLAHALALRVPGVEIVVHAVRSPEDPEPTPVPFGVRVTDAPNAPLSDKWSIGMQAMPRDLGAVMVLGSDDLVTADYVAACVAAVRAGADRVHASGIVFVDMATGEAHASDASRIGAGRVLSRRALDLVGWRPWPPGLNRRLDGGMDRVFRRSQLAEATVPTGGTVQVCDIKTDTNLWSYAAMRQHSPSAAPMDGRRYLRTHFPAFARSMARTKTRRLTYNPALDAAEKEAEAQAAKATAAGGGKRLRALINIPREIAGTDRRVFKGAEFDAQPERVHDLLRVRKCAEEVDAKPRRKAKPDA